MVVLFLARNIETTKFFFISSASLKNKIITIFGIIVHKSFVSWNKKVRWSTTLKLTTVSNAGGVWKTRHCRRVSGPSTLGQYASYCVDHRRTIHKYRSVMHLWVSRLSQLMMQRRSKMLHIFAYNGLPLAASAHYEGNFVKPPVIFGPINNRSDLTAYLFQMFPLSFLCNRGQSSE